jgi:hypothetical protein
MPVHRPFHSLAGFLAGLAVSIALPQLGQAAEILAVPAPTPSPGSPVVASLPKVNYLGPNDGGIPMATGRDRLGRNLIRNGNAEVGPGNDHWGQRHIPAPGWQGLGRFTVMQYDTFGEPPTFSDHGPYERGKNFFAGGLYTPFSGAVQRVDLNDIAATIDKARTTFDLFGFFGGAGWNDDYALLRARFLDAQDRPTLPPVEIGKVKAGDRAGRTGFLSKQIGGVLPIGTRYILLELEMVKGRGLGNSAYADNLSLVLREQDSIGANPLEIAPSGLRLFQGLAQTPAPDTWPTRPNRSGASAPSKPAPIESLPPGPVQVIPAQPSPTQPSPNDPGPIASSLTKKLEPAPIRPNPPPVRAQTPPKQQAEPQILRAIAGPPASPAQPE